MSTSLVEIARTLASGHMPGVVHVRGYPCGLPVRHVTTAAGTPLLLTTSVGALASALTPAAGDGDTAVVLCVDGTDPVLPGPLWLSGWVEPLRGEDARDAALDYAAVNPTEDLLDVGGDHTLYRMEIGEVRLAIGRTLVDIDIDAFRAASPGVVTA